MNVLCVGDGSLDLTATLLERRLPDATIRTAAGIPNALEALESEPPHCLVSGYGASGRTGLELLEAVREKQPSLPIIVLAESSDETTSGEITGVEFPRNGDKSQYDRLAERIDKAVSRYRNEREHGEERRFLEGVFESIPDVLYAFDTEGNPLRWNDRFEAVTGYSEVEIESMSVSEFAPKSEAEALEEGFRTILEERHPVTEEFTLETKDGRHLPYEFTGGVLEAEDGSVRGVTGIGRDISERKDRERQLSALNRSIERLLSAETREGVAELGVEAAREILGLKANAIHLREGTSGALVPVAKTDALTELIGDPPTFTGDDSVAWRVYESGEPAAVDDVREESDVYNPETAIRSELYLPLGEYGILIAGSSTPAKFDDQDVTVGALLTTHIVSALEQLDREQQLRNREAELKRQNERLDQFSSMVSHDLQNPIAIASGHLELYEETGDEANLESVETAIDRIQSLIADLTAIARHGSTDGEHERVPVPEVAEDAWEMVDTRSATLATEACVITADKSQLQGLFENLFRNAVGHGGAEVTVRVGPLDGGFYVEDTGVGISPDEREKVFEQGYTTGYSGSGVGLTIVSRIAQAHDWTVWLTESAEGGARFEFYGDEREAASE